VFPISSRESCRALDFAQKKDPRHPEGLSEQSVSNLLKAEQPWESCRHAGGGTASHGGMFPSVVAADSSVMARQMVGRLVCPG